MKTLGVVLLIIGLAGTIYYGISALENSNSFKIFDMEVAYSTANWTPVIICVVITVVGILLTSRKKHK